MPSQRFLLVEGIDGYPVSNPHVQLRHGDVARYVGWDPLPAPAEDPDHVLEHYRRAQHVVLDHADLRRAIAHRHLRLLAETVAKTHDAARAKLLPPAAPATAPSSSAPSPVTPATPTAASGDLR